MEGAIKLLQFCIEQHASGYHVFFYYSPHVDYVTINIYNEGVYFLSYENKITWNNWYSPEDLTPERADQIINEIKEKLK